jgi:hypothetical protein
MKRSLNKFYSLALLASLAVVSTPSLAQMYVAESTTSNGTSLNLVLPDNWQGPGNRFNRLFGSQTRR